MFTIDKNQHVAPSIFAAINNHLDVMAMLYVYANAYSACTDCLMSYTSHSIWPNAVLTAMATE